MDFIKVIRSLEELLYEVVIWLVFYPRTLWRIATHPDAATRYSEDEQQDEALEQYTDALSPPLLLMLTILIAHGFQIGMGARMPEPGTAVGKALFGSAQNLLTLRALLFGVLPLVAATTLLRRLGLPLDRKALRGPFFSQCYLATPFALALSAGLVLVSMTPDAARAAGLVLVLGGLAWYLSAETLWFRRQMGATGRAAFLVAAGTFVKAGLYWVVLGAGLAALIS
jgi:hypothetical protein